MKKNTIGLSMIVRNEEATLGRCLESVRGLVDEIVIVDTGSSDRTVEIARLYTDKIFGFGWNDDFSAARNFALDKTSSQWVLYLDADEELDTAPGNIGELINNTSGLEAFFLPIHNMSEDSPGSFSRYMVLRLFRNSPRHRFQGSIHEQVTVARPESVGMAEGPVIWHRPVSGKGRNRKRGRNLALLKRAVEADPDNPFLQYYLGLEWLGLGRPLLSLPCFQRACRDLTDSHILFRAPAVRYLVHCLGLAGKRDEALCVCLEESLRYPSYTDLFFDGGVLLEQRGEFQAAARWFEAALDCGPPPPLFSHTNGSESFLSLYHLGYCHERLARIKDAINYYNRALESNPDYFYPLYNLFLLYLKEEGPVTALERLQAAGHLQRPERAEALALLFFGAGFPDLACQCLEETSPRDSGDGGVKNRPLLAKVKLYDGKIEEALILMEAGMAHYQNNPGQIPDFIMAHLLNGNFNEAKKMALALWRRPAFRGAAWGMINLISLCRNGSYCGYPGKQLEDDAIKTVLWALENCLNAPPYPSRPGAGPTAASYSHLAQSAFKLLAHLTPRGCEALASFLGIKAKEVGQSMEKNKFLAGRLFQ